MIYGAEYDASHSPLSYYMKDSYGPNFTYMANPVTLHTEMLNITTASPD